MIAILFAQTSIAPVEEKIGLFQMMQRGGPLMVVLFVCSVVALGVFIERMFYYKRSRMNVSEYLAGVLALVRRQSYAEAISRCEEGHGPIVAVVRTAIYKRHLPPADLRVLTAPTMRTACGVAPGIQTARSGGATQAP